LKSPINTDAHEQSAAEENEVMVISSDRGAEDGTHNLFEAKRMLRAIMLISNLSLL